MLRRFVSAKLHGITVTEASVEYVGSVTIDSQLLDKCGIEPYEAVDVVNLNTGGRWTTYVIPGPPNVFALNGGGARLGVVGDRCVVMTYALAEEMPGAIVLFLDELNEITERASYT